MARVRRFESILALVWDLEVLIHATIGIAFFSLHNQHGDRDPFGVL